MFPSENQNINLFPKLVGENTVLHAKTVHAFQIANGREYFQVKICNAIGQRSMPQLSGGIFAIKF